MQRNIFPLQANGYYLNRQGEVVKLKTCSYPGWLVTEDETAYVGIYDGRFGNNNMDHPLDIVDIAMVVGQRYRLRGLDWNGNPRSAVVTTVYPENDFRTYPVLAEEHHTHADGTTEVMYHSMTRDGYYYSDRDPASSDFMGILVGGLSYENTRYTQVYKRRQPIEPQVTVNLLTNWYEEIDRVVLAKIKSGEYELPDDFPYKLGTGVHVSTQDRNLLAYYPTLRHWQRKVPMQIKPGRYLRQFYPDWSDDRVRTTAALIGDGELKFYSHWYDIFKAYRDLDINGIVSSCMSKDDWGQVHPLMVYHQSDVELAVLYKGGRPVARALYNKKNKHYPMIYGQWENMKVALDAAGFKHASLDGARIRKLPRYYRDSLPDFETVNVNDLHMGMSGDNDCILLPYIDHKRELDRSGQCSTRVNIDDDHIVIQYDGRWEANNYSGAYVYVSDEKERCSCENCGSNEDSEEDGYYLDRQGIWICSHCYDTDTVRLYTHYNQYEVVTRDFAEDRGIYIDAADRYYSDHDAANSAGYVWSEVNSDWYDSDDAVWVEEEGDFYHVDDIGKWIVYDDVAEEYVTKETYEERLAEREQETQEAA